MFIIATLARHSIKSYKLKRQSLRLVVGCYTRTHQPKPNDAKSRETKGLVKLNFYVYVHERKKSGQFSPSASLKS